MTKMSEPPSSLANADRVKRRREWAPLYFFGCIFSAWARLLIRNHFAVHWTRLPFVVLCTCQSIANSIMAFGQKIVFDKRVAKTSIDDPPVFVVGHWRLGTTLLHELLVLDERHTGPTTYEVLASPHFLLTERIERSAGFLLPAHRPMDNMEMSFQHPLEDEFMFSLRGVPSPSLTNAFPNRPPQYPGLLTWRKSGSRGPRRIWAHFRLG